MQSAQQLVPTVSSTYDYLEEKAIFKNLDQCLKFRGSCLKESVGLKWEDKAMKAKLYVQHIKGIVKKPRVHVRELCKITSQ